MTAPPGRQNSFPSLVVEIADQTGNSLTLEPGGSLPVTLQDQTTPTVIIKANKLIIASTLAALAVRDAYTVLVADSTGMTVGDLMILTSNIANRYYYGRILNITGPTITLDTPLDYAFELGQSASACETNMAAAGFGNGSVTPQIFSLRAAEPVGGINLTVDVTRVLIECLTTSGTSLANFGNIPALARGLVLRRVDGDYFNIFNVKSGSELRSIAYDYDPTTVAGQGQDGFGSRLTFAGQNKMGVVQRIGPGEDLQVINQDDILLISSLEITFEGSIVQP